jgi:large subunit ribosomal protein L3
MGDHRVTVRNVEVVQSDPDRNLLLVKGSVPGARNSLVLVQKSKKIVRS